MPTTKRRAFWHIRNKRQPVYHRDRSCFYLDTIAVQPAQKIMAVDPGLGETLIHAGYSMTPCRSCGT